MTYFHPSLRLPPQKLDVQRGEMLAPDNGGGSVVVAHVFVDDEPTVAELFGHRCAGIRSRMLNVRPVDVSTGEFEIRLDRLACVVRVADDEAANDEHPVS